MTFKKDLQFYKFCFYGFLKNLRFFDAFFLLYLHDAGLSYTEIGSLYAIRELWTNFWEVPTGMIADLYGRKTSLVVSFVAYIFSFLLFYAGGGYAVFLGAFLLYGWGDALRSGANKAMIMSYLERRGWWDQKIAYYGGTRACSQRGSAVSSLIAGFIVFSAGNYQSVFLLSIIPYVLNMALVLSYPSYLNRASAKKKVEWREAVKALILTLRRPGVFGIINTAAMHSAFLKAVKDYIQPVMTKVALALPVLAAYSVEKRTGLGVGVMYFILYLMNSFGSLYAYKFVGANRRKTNYYTLTAGLVFGLLSGIFDYWQYVVPALLFFAAIYVVENIRKPVLTGFLADEVPEEILTSVLSAQSLYRSLLTALIALGFGIVADHFGLAQAMIITSAVLILWSFVLKRQRTQRSP